MLCRSRLWTLFLCCALLALTACGTLSTTGLVDSDLEAAKLTHGQTLKEDVDTLIEPMVESGHTPGVIVGVLLPDGTMHFFGYGVSNKDLGEKPHADTLFAVGSLSKGYLAALTAQLVDEGVISWNDNLRTLLPPGTVLSPDAAKITLLQLATHTSGLPRQPVTTQTLRYFIEYLFDGESFYGHFDTAYTLNYLADYENDSDNDGEPHYSNIGYGILGYILEQKTGKSVDQLLKQRITKPLGMKCTGYEPKILPCYPYRAHGYAGDEPKFIARGEPTPDWEFTSLMRGSAAIHSTARELLAFAAAHIPNGTKLNAVLADNLRVRFPRAREAAAIAWVVDDVEGEPIAYQIGLVGGYTSYIGIDVRHKTAVVVMQNSFNWDNSMGHKLLLSLRYMDFPRD